jgi:hypothetical protein
MPEQRRGKCLIIVQWRGRLICKAKSDAGLREKIFHKPCFPERRGLGRILLLVREILLRYFGKLQELSGPPEETENIAGLLP